MTFKEFLINNNLEKDNPQLCMHCIFRGDCAGMFAVDDYGHYEQVPCSFLNDNSKIDDIFKEKIC